MALFSRAWRPSHATRSTIGAAVLCSAVGVFASLTACSGSSDGGHVQEPTTSTGGTGANTTATPASKGSAPEFTLRSLEGKNVALSEHLGKKVILLDFWSTTCAPCLVELPHVVKIYEKYKDRGFVVLAIAGDGPDTSSQVPAEAHAKKLTFPVLLDEESSVMALFTPNKDMPFVVLIDKGGNVVKKKHGYEAGDEVKLAEEIEKLL